MAFELGSITAKIDADITGFKKGMNDAKAGADDLTNKLKSVGAGIADFSKQAMVFTGIVAAGAVAFGKQSVDAYNESQAALKQLNAVMESTGGVAGVTKEQVIHLAQSLQTTTKYSDESVLSAENLLLTFTNIGSNIFPEATKTVLNMSTALGQDLKSSSIQLGKALQDPILGVSALRRVGVNFSEKQQDVIKNLVETGHALDAQKMILKELDSEFGGSAAAAADTFGGKIEQLKNKFNDFQENVGGVIATLAEFAAKGGDSTPLFDALTAIVDDDTAEAITDFISKLRDGFVELGQWISDNQALVTTFLQGLAIGIGALLIVGTVTGLLMLLLNPLTLVVAGITALYVAWQTNFGGIRDITQQVITAIIGFYNDNLKPSITALVEFFTANWAQIKDTVILAWDIIKGVLQIGWAIISSMFAVFLALLTGNWSGAWETIKKSASSAWSALQNIFNSMVSYLSNWGGNILNALTAPFRNAWSQIEGLINKIRGALDFTERHSPSIMDILNKSVRLANGALDNLRSDFILAPETAAMTVSNGGTSSKTLAVSIDMAGAFISDTYGAQRMAEIVGDQIIRKVQGQLRL